MNDSDHREKVVDQFSRQAAPFARKFEGRDDATLELMLELAAPTAADTVLDVACGPGLVACAFAERTGRVTGIDLTPAMLDSARARQRERGLTNLTWVGGEATRLPFPDGAFTLVLSRFSFHHHSSPQTALAEMRRVCRRGGRVVVADVTPEADKRTAFDHFERLRDPSHVRALTTAELERMMAAVGLEGIRAGRCQVDMELERQLAASFPCPGDAERLRALLRADVGRDRIGVGAREQDGEIHLAYPVSVVAAAVPP